MSVIDRIKEEMLKKGFSQNKLAKAAQMSQSGLSSILNGNVSPKENTLQAIAKALNMSLPELMNSENGEKKEPPTGAALDQALIEMLIALSPSEVQRVQDFVAGMKASDKA